jgi:hypothetical protein
VIKRFLIEFMLVNCKNDSPTEAEKNITIIIRPKKTKQLSIDAEVNSKG